MRLNSTDFFDVFVNKEQRVVTVKLHVSPETAGNEMLDIIRKSSSPHFAIDEARIAPSIALKDTYIGIAKCHENDVFDEAKGIEIARLRAIKAYTKDRKRIAHKLVNIFNDITARLADSATYFDYAITHIDSAIEIKGSSEE